MQLMLILDSGHFLFCAVLLALYTSLFRQHFIYIQYTTSRLSGEVVYVIPVSHSLILRSSQITTATITRLHRRFAVSEFSVHLA